MDSITIKGPSISQTPIEKQASPSGASGSFADILKGAVSETNSLLLNAEDTATKVVTGDSGSLHQAMIALEKADISFRTLLQVRNKVLEAYQEVMRMQV